MIFKSSFPNSPNVTILISGVAVDYTSIQSVTLEITENQHDMATIIFTGLIPKAITDYTGAPVYISISLSPTQISSFNGYITYIEPEMHSRKGLINNSPVQTATAVCFGASYDMSQTTNKVWSNITLPHLVETLATKYNYSYSVPSDFFTWKSLLQNAKSDWAFLKEACNSIGYYMTTSGTHIHVYDPYKIISRQMPYVELMTVRGTGGDLEYTSGKIMEFKGTFGDRTPEGSSSNYTYVGMDSRGVIHSASTDDTVSTKLGEVVPARYVETVATNVQSLEALNRFVTAAMKTDYPYNATAVITGTPDPVPGSVIKLNNYDSMFDGYWLTRSVKHTVSRSNYITELTIATDSTNGKYPEVLPSTAFKAPPMPVLLNNKWISKKAFGEVYV
jgi:phage protein D